MHRQRRRIPAAPSSSRPHRAPGRRPARAVLAAAAFATCFVALPAGCPLLNSPAAPDVGPFSTPESLRLETVVDGAAFPIALAFLPDGTLLYTEKNTGRVRRIYADGTLQPEPFADLDVANLGDAGLLGITLDPDHAANGHIYVAVAVNDLPGDNSFARTEMRIVRLTAAGNTAAADQTLVIASVPGEPTPGHEGGNVHVGPDGRLYLTVGDRGLNRFPNEQAQDPDELAGRILRYQRDGSIPADNPFGPANPTFALGKRNSFDFTFDPLSGGLFATENGPVGDDEINLVEPGHNYGWPRVSGFADSDAERAFAAATERYREPLTLVGRAPTGIDFYEGGAYGDEWIGQLFFAEWATGTVKRATLSPDRRTITSIEVVADGIPGGINDIEFSPQGVLYLSVSNAIVRLMPDG